MSNGEGGDVEEMVHRRGILLTLLLKQGEQGMDPHRDESLTVRLRKRRKK